MGKLEEEQYFCIVLVTVVTGKVIGCQIYYRPRENDTRTLEIYVRIYTFLNVSVFGAPYYNLIIRRLYKPVSNDGDKPVWSSVYVVNESEPVRGRSRWPL